jgi:tetratricopeptide (TPR) repeat protein
VRRGLFGAALLSLAWLLAGFSPFQAEERNVREGNERQATGDPQGALRRYDAAERAVGARPEIDYDRGGALFRLGRSAEARQAWKRSLEKGAGPLGSRAHQNLGTALAGEGDREGAIAAFTEALRLDPQNEDARFGLEVLLRRKQAEEAARQGGQPDPSPSPGDQGKGPEEPKAPPPGPEQGQSQGAERTPPAQRPAPAPGEPERRDGQERGRPDGARGGQAAPLSRQEAERLLDALRSREQAMPLGGADRRRARRADGDRDW